jgi:hypothetical protein
MQKMVSVTIRNRARAALFIFALLALGAVLLTVGLALLLGLLAAGMVIGAGLAVYRALGGKRASLGGAHFYRMNAHSDPRISDLDPALEIASPRAAVVRAKDDLDSHA